MPRTKKCAVHQHSSISWVSVSLLTKNTSRCDQSSIHQSGHDSELCSHCPHNNIQARREYLQKKEQGEEEAKKKDASVFGGREEDIDKGLFGEGAELVGGPEDTITKVAKSNPYTGKLPNVLK